MIAILTDLFGGMWARIAVIVAVIALLVGGYALIRQSGINAERASAALQEQRDETNAGRIRSGIDGLSDQSVDDRLRRYQRQ